MRKLYWWLVFIVIILCFLGIYIYTQVIIFKDNNVHINLGTQLLSNTSDYNIGLAECNKATYMSEFCILVVFVKQYKRNETITKDLCDSIPEKYTDIPLWVNVLYKNNIDLVRKSFSETKMACYNNLTISQ